MCVCGRHACAGMCYKGHTLILAITTEWQAIYIPFSLLSTCIYMLSREDETHEVIAHVCVAAWQASHYYMSIATMT